MKTRHTLVLFAALGSLISVVSACTSSDTNRKIEGDLAAVTSIQTANPYGAGLVDPAQPGESILQVNIRGNITEYSFESLKKLPATTVELFEPFIKERSSFTGVALVDLFLAVGIKSSDNVDTLALNEYRYVNFAGEFSASDGLLAYEQNGQPIPVDRGGPIRIVFPDGNPLSGLLDAWNWALSSITVK